MAPTISPFSWNLVLDTPGYLKDPPIKDGVQDFVTAYNMSDRYYEMEVFKDDCSTPTDGLTLTSTNDYKYGGSNHLEATFLYNQSAIQQSNLWTSNSTGGHADFCLKLSLYSNSTGGILFNFIETIYKVEVDLLSGFSTEVDIVRTTAGDGGKDIVDVDENITVYQCNDTYNEITSPPALTQGEALQICVETEDGSAFEVASFKDVSISQNGTKSFDYVSNFVNSYWASSSCKDTNTPTSVCKLKMQLLGEYFSEADPADLTVEGVVKMDYLGRRVLRTLSSSSSTSSSLTRDSSGNDIERSLRSDGADFSINVNIASPNGAAGDTTMKDGSDVGGSAFESNTMSGAGNMMMYGSILVSSIIILMRGITLGVCW